MQSLKVPIVEILGHPGAYRDIEVSCPLPEVRNSLARLSDTDETAAKLRAESVVEGILVTGTAVGKGHFTCARCLTALDSSLEIEVCELFVTPGHEVPAEEEAYEVKGTEIDLEPMMRDAFVLALPLNPVCGPDCKGLCGSCGKNLNEGPCDCAEDDIDPRWAALSELREKLS